MIRWFADARIFFYNVYRRVDASTCRAAFGLVQFLDSLWDMAHVYFVVGCRRFFFGFMRLRLPFMLDYGRRAVALRWVNPRGANAGAIDRRLIGSAARGRSTRESTCVVREVTVAVEPAGM